MPIPVSLTPIQSYAGFDKGFANNVILPLGVNLIAFDKKLIKIYRNRLGSENSI